MSTTPFAGATLRPRRPQDTHPDVRSLHGEPQQPYFHPTSGPHSLLLRQTSVHVHAANITAIITSYRPQKNPCITAVLVCWLLGVVAAFVGSGPAMLDSARLDRYSLLHQQVCAFIFCTHPHGSVYCRRSLARNPLVINHTTKSQLMESTSRRASMVAAITSAVKRVEDAKATGWWLHTEQRAEVKRLQQEADQLRLDAAAELAKADALVKQQRQVIGLWSARGIKNARSFFWYELRVNNQTTLPVPPVVPLFKSAMMCLRTQVVAT